MQTLREKLAEAERESRAHGDMWPGESRWRTAYGVLGMLKLLDLPVLDGVGLVAMDREAGARKLAMEMGFWHPSRGTPTIREVRPAFDAILTACGIIPVDEVVESVQSKHIKAWPMPIAVVGDREIVIHSGDTITITRKPSESPNGCSRKSTLQPPVNGRKEGSA